MVPLRPVRRSPPSRSCAGIADGGFLVVFGTGSYITEEDGTSTDIESIYGIWDRGEVSPATALASSKFDRLVEQSITNLVDESAALFERLRIVSANSVAYLPDAGATPGVYGWYIDLDMARATDTLQGNANPDTSGNPPPAAQFPGERAYGASSRAATRCWSPR